MTTLAASTAPSSLRRVRALAAAETRLLLRNRTAIVNSVLSPLLFVAVASVLGIGGGEAGGMGLLVTAVAVTLVFLTYYNLVTTYVARREDLVLQRMRTGELTDGEVLAGTAVPTLLVTVGQLALITVGVAALGGWRAPADVVLPVLTVLLGAVLMVALATASTTFTRTPESAQITTLPVVFVTMALSGLVFPLSALPDALATAARLLPVTPVVELVQLGLSGRTWDGEVVAGAELWWAALGPLGTLLAWTALAALATARWFRWAPRR
jgi:ABC-type multidrug transport system permease subunit